MIGDLNKRITIQYPSEVADVYGGSTTTWTELCNIWAAIWPTSAREVIRSMQNVMEITYRIRIRYRSDILPNYRIKFGTKYFNIVSIINPNERGEWLDILAKEAV